MKKILDIYQTITTAQNLHKQQKTIVLTGGCFDILHDGHLSFLKQAKNLGYILIVLLESDETTKKIKGPTRPINSQKKRAQNLSKLEDVNYICLLSSFMDNNEYDKLVLDLEPAIIATTKGDPLIAHKKRQADMLGTQVIELDKIPGISTTQLLDDLQKK